MLLMIHVRPGIDELTNRFQSLENIYIAMTNLWYQAQHWLDFGTLRTILNTELPQRFS